MDSSEWLLSETAYAQRKSRFLQQPDAPPTGAPCFGIPAAPSAPLQSSQQEQIDQFLQVFFPQPEQPHAALEIVHFVLSISNPRVTSVCELSTSDRGYLSRYLNMLDTETDVTPAAVDDAITHVTCLTQTRHALAGMQVLNLEGAQNEPTAGGN